ncbi:transcriptional repressor LexA [Allorhodopirellula heiligendammensis]|uniref:LexA repressor n=1 Tax=Allorhodopirellula heiligendammensis TaxID=2714739 RepID=A0A5C6BZR1_9BACT|nr:transcriptional repressor LexA [Allorhodopirellula heiligendammensis]TWU16109.1 LexA repressor [Allorhodopirellula heiligendammensis]
MATPQLTERQRHVYELIRSLIQDRGYGPTVREIGEHFGIKSPNGVMCHLRALEKKGLITRKANKSRAIELTGEHARSTTALPLLGIVSEHPAPLNLDSPQVIDLGKSLATGDRVLVQVSGGAFAQQGILDGDYLVVEQNREGQEGDLVVCQFPGGHVALRTWDDRQVADSLLGVAVSMIREKI